jgi:hypothetical protein
MSRAATAESLPPAPPISRAAPASSSRPKPIGPRFKTLGTKPKLADEPKLDCRRRALALWPGLDLKKLSRTRGEPRRVARLISRRTSLSFDEILGILLKKE